MDLRLPAPVLEGSIFVLRRAYSGRSRSPPARNGAQEVAPVVAPSIAGTMDQPPRRTRFSGCQDGRARALICSTALQGNRAVVVEIERASK